jgi:hypothetical protein
MHVKTILLLLAFTSQTGDQRALECLAKLQGGFPKWTLGFQPRLAARGWNTPHSALVFGPVGGVHNAINALVDLLEDEGTG